jgi:hypothetical protein
VAFKPPVETARGPAAERAEQLWRASGGSMSFPELSERLAAEGYGDIKVATIRSWKLRYNWNLAAALASIDATPLTVAVTFQECADALQTLGITAAAKVTAFVARQDPAKMDLNEAIALTKIMSDAIAAAGALETSILARLRSSMPAIADNSDGKTVEGTQPEAPLDAVVAMFRKPMKTVESRNPPPESRK